MSLARTLMNGGSYSTNINPARYGESNGALRIAMESTEELHEIFLESFYNVEQAELAAATEGIALEGSQYEAVAEASLKGAMAKIKEFFKKLWDKVKAFFHAIKRFIDSIFMSGKEFAKKYQADIKKVKRLEDFTFKMYNYNDGAIDSAAKIENLQDQMAQMLITEDVLDYVGNADEAVPNNTESRATTTADKIDQARDSKRGGNTLDKFKADLESQRNKMRNQLIGKTGTGELDDEEFATGLFGVWRNGAEDDSDKEEIDVTDLTKYMDILISSDSKPIDKLTKTCDTTFSKAIKLIDKAEKETDKGSAKDKADVTAALRVMSSEASACQSDINKFMTSWKAVFKERDTAYKSCIVAGISAGRKQKK